MSHIVRLAMNIPISGTNSLITFPASAPFTLYGMKKTTKKTKKHLLLLMTFSTGTESNLKAKKKLQTPSNNKSLQYVKYEDDQGTLDRQTFLLSRSTE